MDITKKPNRNKKNKRIWNIFFLLLSLFSSLFIFPKIWYSIINSLIIDPILSKVEDQSLAVSLSVVILGGVLYFYFYRNNRKHEKVENWDKIIFVSALIITYSLCRFVASGWGFLHFYYLSPIAYSDILFPILIILLFQSFKKLLRYKRLTKNRDKIKIEQKYISFLTDTPSSEDDYKRQPWAEHLYKSLLETFNNNRKTGNDAFTIGISGSWGSGKTSFFNLLIKEMEEDNAIFFECKPWLCNNEKEIITEFFNTIKKELTPYNPSISRQADSYLEKLLQIEDNIYTRAIRFICSTYNNKTSFSEYEQLGRSIKMIDCPIFVFLDDLDRMSGNEILETLKIIRNTANFSNVFYIIAYDKEYLLEVMEKNNVCNPRSYLEKIINLEIPLPAFEDYIIEYKLKEQISTIIKNYNFAQNDINDCLKLIKSELLFSHCFTNFRDITRFANSFSLSIYMLSKQLEKAEIKDEIKLSDLFLLEVLKLKYLSIFNILKDNKKILIKESEDSVQYFLKEDYSEYVKASLSYEVKKYRDHLIKTGRINTDNESSQKEASPSNECNVNDFIPEIINQDQNKSSEECINILKELFPSITNSGTYHSAAYTKSIKFRKYYYRYFLYRLNDKDIPFNEFVSLVIEERDPKEKIKEYIKSKKQESLHHCFLKAANQRSLGIPKILNAYIDYWQILNITDEYSRTIGEFGQIKLEIYKSFYSLLHKVDGESIDIEKLKDDIKKVFNNKDKETKEKMKNLLDERFFKEEPEKLIITKEELEKQNPTLTPSLIPQNNLD